MQCTLLLVDDEPNIPRSIQRALRSENYNILMANDAATALHLCEQEKIDVVVSDHRMPDVTGVELLSEIRNRYPETVRIMLSGQADLDDVIRAVNDGAVYKFLTKPWHNDTLRSVLKEAATIAQTQFGADAADNAEFANALSSVELPAYLVLLEVRNVSALRALSANLTDGFVAELTRRCERVLGPLHLPITFIDENVAAFAVGSTSLEQLEELAAQLCLPYYLADQIAMLRIAIGAAQHEPKQPAVDCIKHGLVALSATNFSGEATVYTNLVKGDLHDKRALERDMQNGLQRNEFFLQIQPQVRGSTLAIEGGETLCRWRHKDQGLISPGQFIDMAERTGFINELGLWVIEQSCELLRALKNRGLDKIKISFNVSPRQFSTSDWTQLVVHHVQQAHLDPSKLVVEITESSVMDNPTHALRVLTQLKETGIQIALDDFGTGHSSLAMLNELPIDVLKLDRSLIRGVAEDPRSRTMFSYLVKMAHELGIATIAEGVEDQTQVELCQTLDCDFIQGYAFYKPMHLSEFVRALDGELDG